ncbi:hypothetical protein DY000_02061512 [Brassica cretica]|uniref:Uncharacterized protein n=1 Tax=Brassica cretica TaxID=69181 RepID=A0ABQ7AZ22_BRACR|nr:hypothetical protein DY000_02061512 [Brassica cretica]
MRISQFQQLVSERLTRNLQEDQNTLRIGMGPFKVEREVQQRLVRRSWNCGKTKIWKFSCGKSILKATQSNLATKGVEYRKCDKAPR